MDFKSLKGLSELSENELTAKLIALFSVILEYHDRGKGVSPFSWRDLAAKEDGTLYLDNLTETDLTEDTRLRNYTDYAGIIYCVCANKKSAESMSWDGGRKIRYPVLREIVLTIGGRNDAIEPLITKLRQPYVDDDTFFNGYTTVDEKEANEHYAKSLQIQMQNYREEEEYKRSLLSRSPWYKGLGSALIIMLCIGGYKACKRSDEFAKQQQWEILRNISLPRTSAVPAPVLPKEFLAPKEGKNQLPKLKKIRIPEVKKVQAPEAGKNHASEVGTPATTPTSGNLSSDDVSNQ